ncbi:MAG: MATE family efflux transporter [Clostridia bacterium]|nr:MATE family efflux transporter [Clostridia bacterium]
MQNSADTRLFESMPVAKAVMKMSVPTVISSLVIVIYNLADTFFVGFLNNPVQNAAVTLSAPVLLAFNAVNNLFGVGSSSMMSRALGKKDYDTAKRSSATGFYCALASALLFSLSFTAMKNTVLGLLGADSTTYEATSGYLFWTVTCGAVPSILNVVMAYMVRSEGASLHSSIGTMSGCLLNIILDPIFILPQGLGMGARGAGLATFISNCFALCYFLVLTTVKRKKTFVCLNPKRVTKRKEVLLGICAVGIPSAIQNILNVTGMTILNNFAAAFGADPVAAIGIAYKINMIPLQISLGVSQGIMPLIGYNYSARNYKRMKGFLIFTSRIVLSMMLVTLVIFFLFSDKISGLFIDTPSVVGYSAKFLQGMCISLPFLCMDFLAVGVFQACGMGKKALVFAILRKIVFEIPFIFILNHFFPLYGLAWAQTCAEVILAAVALTVLVKMFRRLEREVHH